MIMSKGFISVRAQFLEADYKSLSRRFLWCGITWYKIVIRSQSNSLCLKHDMRTDEEIDATFNSAPRLLQHNFYFYCFSKPLHVFKQFSRSKFKTIRITFYLYWKHPRSFCDKDSNRRNYNWNRVSWVLFLDSSRFGELRIPYAFWFWPFSIRF